MPLLFKNDENTQFGRTSDALGNRSFVLPQNNGSEPLVDDNGRIIVRLADATGFITPSIEGGALVYSSAGYLNNAIVNGNSTHLFLASGFNPTATQLFLQFFDANALPANGTIPDYNILVPALSNFSWMPSITDRFRNIGLVWGVSTTGPTYTDALIANGFWVDIEYSNG